MNNFSKFCYGVRALSVGALGLLATYDLAKQAGIVDGVKQKVNNIKNRKRNKEMNKIFDNTKGYETNSVIEEAAKNMYYSECFKSMFRDEN